MAITMPILKVKLTGYFWGLRYDSQKKLVSYDE